MKVSTEAIWKNFDNCWQYEHIKRVKDTVEPLVRESLKKLKEYKAENQNMKEIIKRFDEVIHILIKN